MHTMCRHFDCLFPCVLLFTCLSHTHKFVLKIDFVLFSYLFNIEMCEIGLVPMCQTYEHYTKWWYVVYHIVQQHGSNFPSIQPKIFGAKAYVWLKCFFTNFVLVPFRFTYQWFYIHGGERYMMLPKNTENVYAASFGCKFLWLVPYLLCCHFSRVLFCYASKI